jgi:hypothetical protein
MSQLRKEDIKQEVFDLYDDYAHNRIDRRNFMQQLSTYAVGGITVAALSSFLMPDYNGQIQIAQNDPRLTSEYINYPSPKGAGTIKGLLSKPVDVKGKLGGIVVVHENRGLNMWAEGLHSPDLSPWHPICSLRWAVIRVPMMPAVKCNRSAIVIKCSKTLLLHMII